MDFKAKDPVLYIPWHIAKDKKLPEQLPELRNNREVEKGVVVDVNEPSQLVFVLMAGDFNPKACSPRDLYIDVLAPTEATPSPTPTPVATKPGEASAQTATAATAGAGPVTSKP